MGHRRKNAPDAPESQALREIMGKAPSDLKPILGGRKYDSVDRIALLLEKKLIFPYVSLKNLGFQEKITIVLFGLTPSTFDRVKTIFFYFNYGFIYEIEGEYFTYGQEQETRFETGAMIELYLPSVEINEFQRAFKELFQVLGVSKYLVLYDMVESNHFLKSVFGNDKFLNSYNPLANLIWSNKDKKWRNHKVFNKKFEAQYPDLDYGSQRSDETSS